MRVKMTKTEKGSEDGRFVTEFKSGQEYEVPEKLGKTFIEMGVATEAKPAEPKAKPAETDGKGKK